MVLTNRANADDSRRDKFRGNLAAVFRMLFVILVPIFLCGAKSVPDGGCDEPPADAGPSDDSDRSDDHDPLVCLSPGHPSRPGDKQYEAVLNRRVAYKLRALLLRAGYDVVLTTDDLTDETLFAPGFDSEDKTIRERLEVKTPDEKAEICNDAGADYVISIHHNYAYNPDINYTLVFYGADESGEPNCEEAKRWAQSTAHFLRRVMKTDGSRTYSDMERLGFSLSILENSKAPAILTEAAFYSNPRERKRLSSDAYLAAEAQAIFDAFHAHYQENATSP